MTPDRRGKPEEEIPRLLSNSTTDIPFAWRPESPAATARSSRTTPGDSAHAPGRPDAAASSHLQKHRCPQGRHLLPSRRAPAFQPQYIPSSHSGPIRTLRHGGDHLEENLLWG